MQTQIPETSEKAMIDDEMAYFFGLFRGSYDEVLGELCRNCRSVAYQFLHRAASACHMANGPEGRTPVLAYQLFFDRDDVAHVAALEAFKANLRRWANALRLRNMKFLILSVPVTNMAEVKAGNGLTSPMP